MKLNRVFNKVSKLDKTINLDDFLILLNQASSPVEAPNIQLKESSGMNTTSQNGNENIAESDIWQRVMQIEPDYTIGRKIDVVSSSQELLINQLEILIRHPSVPEIISHELANLNYWRIFKLPQDMTLELTHYLNEKYVNTSLRFNEIPTENQLNAINKRQIQVLDGELDDENLFEDEFAQFSKEVFRQKAIDDFKFIQKGLGLEMTGILDEKTMDKISLLIATAQILDYSEKPINFMNPFSLDSWKKELSGFFGVEERTLELLGMHGAFSEPLPLSDYSGPISSSQILDLAQKASQKILVEIDSKQEVENHFNFDFSPKI